MEIGENSKRWTQVHRLLSIPGPLASPGFIAGQETIEFLHMCQVLVIGAGGLGCELLKGLAMTGFTDIHVIDMDTIDISNLNRQFLFRPKDVGKSKAKVAAEFIMKRIPGCKVTPYFGKIQDKDENYYKMFPIIICGLDSVEARRWINSLVVGMYDENDPTTLIPIIDGGTEGFKGQARIIIPKQTACYECSLDMQTKPKTFPMCTIANTPRLPEHCIQWAATLQWPLEYPNEKLDGDNPDHINWCLQKAQERANAHLISGITYSMTQGVVKNIIPAIASTNAIVAASCVNEAYKIATNCQKYLSNYMMYTGDQGIYTYTFELERKENCPVCGVGMVDLQLKRTDTVNDLIEMLLDKQEIQLKRPSLRSGSTTIYMQAPAVLEQQTRGNLTKLVVEFVEDNGIIDVTDMNLPISLCLRISFE